MHSSSWKREEREVGRAFGGDRSGPLGQDVQDCTAEGYCIEVKFRAAMTYHLMKQAVRDSERRSKSDEIPIAVVRKFGDPKSDRMVIMSLDSFLHWFGPQALAALGGIDD